MWTDKKNWKDYIRLKEERPLDFKPSENLDIITDQDIVNRYTEDHDVVLGIAYRSRYNIMVVDLVKDSLGKIFTYERIFPAVQQGAIVTVPLYEDHFVILRQFRHSLRDIQYAFPRGYGEKDITPEENVKKELQEEIGANDIRDIVYLGNVVADSGLCGNSVDVYTCSVDVVKTHPMYEGIENALLLTEIELREWIKDGKINDGFTLSAFCLYCTR